MRLGNFLTEQGNLVILGIKIQFFLKRQNLITYLSEIQRHVVIEYMYPPKNNFAMNGEQKNIHIVGYILANSLYIYPISMLFLTQGKDYLNLIH